MKASNSLWNWTEEKLGLFSTALDQSKHTEDATVTERDGNDENDDESSSGVFRVLAIGGTATENSLDPLARIAKHVLIEAPPHRNKLEAVLSLALSEDAEPSPTAAVTPSSILDRLRTQNHFDATALAAAEACIAVECREGFPLEPLAAPGSLQLSYGFDTTHKLVYDRASPTHWALFPTCPCDHPHSTPLNMWRSQAQSELLAFARARHAELAPGGFFCGSFPCLERGLDSAPWSRFGSLVKSFAQARTMGLPMGVRHEPNKCYDRRNWPQHPKRSPKDEPPKQPEPTHPLAKARAREEKRARLRTFLRNRAQDKPKKPQDPQASADPLLRRRWGQAQIESAKNPQPGLVAQGSIDFRASAKARDSRLNQLRKEAYIKSAKKPQPGRAVLPVAFRTRDEVLAAFGTGWKVWRCEYVLAKDPAAVALKDAETSIPKALVSEARRTYVQHLVETFKAACLKDLVQSSVQERSDDPMLDLDDSTWLACATEAKDRARIFWEAACDDCAEAILREYEDGTARWPLHQRYHLGVPTYLVLAQKCD